MMLKDDPELGILLKRIGVQNTRAFFRRAKSWNAATAAAPHATISCMEFLQRCVRRATGDGDGEASGAHAVCFGPWDRGFTAHPPPISFGDGQGQMRVLGHTSAFPNPKSPPIRRLHLHAKLVEVFQRIDADDDGMVSAAEFNAALEVDEALAAICASARLDSASDAFQQVDLDRNGFVTVAEFVSRFRHAV